MPPIDPRTALLLDLIGCTMRHPGIQKQILARITAGRPLRSEHAGSPEPFEEPELPREIVDGFEEIVSRLAEFLAGGDAPGPGTLPGGAPGCGSDGPRVDPD